MTDLIYNQTKIPKAKWRYGLRSSAATGCGWIATHNALRLMGYETDIPGLIRYFQRLLPLIHGNAGTFFWAPALCFYKWGFPVKLYVSRSHFDRAAKESDVCILFYHWRNKWKFGAHFVALQYKDGTFTGYNTYRSSTGPDPYGPSLESFLQKRHYFGTVLIGIRDRRSTAT